MVVTMEDSSSTSYSFYRNHGLDFNGNTNNSHPQPFLCFSTKSLPIAFKLLSSPFSLMTERIAMGSWRRGVQSFLLTASVALNMILCFNFFAGGGGVWWLKPHCNSTTTSGDHVELSWSRKAVEEAEAVAALTCSGHGSAFLDGLVVQGQLPICECYGCFGGSDCSQVKEECIADANSGNPLFLEPFWKQHASSSAIVVAGWHRMSYSYDGSLNSKELDKQIRRVHSAARNAVTAGKFIIFGTGSTQLLNAAVHALAADNCSSFPARIVASIPFYPVYKEQTEMFRSEDYEFAGEAALWKNRSGASTDGRRGFVEFVTSPNNPDGQLKQAILQGPLAKTIYDRAYYWPHFTAIPAPADDDLMIFTISKLTGHAGSRFGWAVIRDERVYKRMIEYMSLNTIGVSKDTQLRALKLLRVVVEGRGRDFFEFGFETMSKRWKKVSKIISGSKRLSLQNIEPLYCNYFQKIRVPSPAYAWVKCEKGEDCTTVLREAGIISRRGSLFGAESRFTRLSLIKSQDDFDLLLHKLKNFVSQEGSPKTM